MHTIAIIIISAGILFLIIFIAVNANNPETLPEDLFINSTPTIMSLKTQIIRLDNEKTPMPAAPNTSTEFVGPVAYGQGCARLIIENLGNRTKYFIFSVRETDEHGTVIEEMGGIKQPPSAEM